MANVEPKVSIFKFKNVPQIDGVITPGEWEPEARIGGFVDYPDEGVSATRTSAFIGYGRRNLYLAFRCYRDAKESSVSDFVEVFIDPGHTHKQYVQFILDCQGNYHDSRMPHRTWQRSDWVATSSGDDYWDIEMKLPFKYLEIDPPGAGDVWGINFVRNFYDKQSVSIWVPTGASFHSPQRFGHLVFSEGNGTSAKNDPFSCGEKVLAPWVPITVKSRRVKCWGRTHDFGDGALPEQISTAGKSILDAPIKLSASCGEQHVELSWSVGRIESKDAYATFASTSDSGDIRLEASTRVEYDGLIWVDVDLTAQDDLSKLDLRLDVPIKSRFAKYIHCPQVSVPGYPYVTGKLPSRGWTGSYPLIWLGDDERGLCWFAEDAGSWPVKDKTRMLQVEREGRTTLMSVRMVDPGCCTSKRLRLSFGIQATPVRPFHEKYQDWRIAQWDAGPYNSEDFKPGETTYDLDVEKYKQAGVNFLVFHQPWAAHYSYPEPFNREDLKRVVRNCHDNGIKVLLYFAPGGLGVESPEFKKFGKDWLAEPGWVWGNGEDKLRPDQVARGVCPASEYSDFLVDGVARLLDEYDIDGLYYDMAYVTLCRNSSHGCDGRYPTLAQRRLFRRLYDLVKSKDEDAIIFHHTSSAMFVPLMSFSDICLSGEHFWYGIGKGLPSLDMIRTEFLGVQWGSPCQFIVWNEGRYSVEEGAAIALLHGVDVTPWECNSPGGEARLQYIARIWEAFEDFNRKEAKWVPYWKSAPYVRCGPSGIKTSFYMGNNGELLLIVSNLQENDQEWVNLKLDWDKLGCESTDVAVDRLNGEKLSLEGFPMKRMSMRMLLVSGVGASPNRESRVINEDDSYARLTRERIV
ncbi:MAG: glycoside hydrolase domain-containing protein [Armatimonadota bacterium]